MNKVDKILTELESVGCLRSIKTPEYARSVAEKEDFSSNDYLAIAQRTDWVDEFLSQPHHFMMTSAASRLLSVRQDDFFALESLLGELYGRSALLFNSGYHANTGLVSALGGKDVLIVADKLVHASIIDGIILSRSKFLRFRHNDMAHLEQILTDNASAYSEVIVITESIFSMDGDCCDLNALVTIKRQFSNVRLYVDEAHAFGVFGKRGLGMSEVCNVINDIDFIIGTLGKAAASTGAFVICSESDKKYFINKSRSLIFSTAMPPICCAWSSFVINKMVGMEAERAHLAKISSLLRDYVNPLNGNIQSSSQIVPYIVGSNERALELSEQLERLGYVALPIRAPTVPTGTERIRFSLNASLTEDKILKLITVMKQLN